MIRLEFGLFGYVCALCFVTFDIYLSARCLCSIVTLRCAVLLCLFGYVVRFILCCVRLVTFVALSCVMFDC